MFQQFKICVTINKQEQSSTNDWFEEVEEVLEWFEEVVTLQKGGHHIGQKAKDWHVCELPTAEKTQQSKKKKLIRNKSDWKGNISFKNINRKSVKYHSANFCLIQHSAM